MRSRSVIAMLSLCAISVVPPVFAIDHYGSLNLKGEAVVRGMDNGYGEDGGTGFRVNTEPSGTLKIYPGTAGSTERIGAGGDPFSRTAECWQASIESGDIGKELVIRTGKYAVHLSKDLIDALFIEREMLDDRKSQPNCLQDKPPIDWNNWPSLIPFEPLPADSDTTISI